MSIEGEAPTLRFPLGSMVTPGDRLGTTRQNLLPSTGTYVHGGHLHASIMGMLTLDKSVAKRANGEKAVCHPAQVVHPQQNPPRFFQVDQVVLGRVTRLSIQQAFVDLLAEQVVGLSALPTFAKAGEGVIRREDVRAAATEIVKMEDMFRPGDLVLCRILSLGDRRYVLGTAEPALGVLQARSEQSNQPMVPLSWKEMQCPITGHKELRKCAKPPKTLLSGRPG